MVANILNSKHNPRSLLILIIGVSVLIRVGAAIYLGDKVVDLPGTYDQISYHNLALRVLGGHGFSFGIGWWPATPANQPTAHWSYLYTLYLVLVYFIFGPHPIVARIIQAVVVGIFQPYLTFKIGQKIFGEWVGLVAALLSTVYIYFIYYSATLMTEPFYITSILWTLFLIVEIGDLPSKVHDFKPSREIKLSIWLGLALTIGVLLRQLLLIVVPFLLLWVWLVRWGKYKKFSLTTTAIVAGVMILFILPITFYNYQRFHRFVLLNTNAGFAFFWGNNPIYGTQFQPILSSTTYGQLIPKDVLSLNEAAMDQELLKRGIGFVISDPTRYILLSISRIPFYFEFWPTPGSDLISNLSRVLSFGIMLPFMLYGIIAALFNHAGPVKDSHRWGSPEVMLIFFSILYATIHILTWTLIRYRLPIDAIFLVFAGFALTDIYRKIIFRLKPITLHTHYKSS
jgi:hypothetical protein